MGWITIKDYIQQYGVSDSTIRRYIRAKRIQSKRIGTKLYVWMEDPGKEEGGSFDISRDGQRIEMLTHRGLSVEKPAISKEDVNSISGLIEFSSKALNSYLLISDKLINEKEKRIEEKESLIRNQSQKIVELESYIEKLEEIEKTLREQRSKVTD